MRSATGSNAVQALYRIRAKPSLRLSCSISASRCDAWDEATFHPLNATSTTIHVSIGISSWSSVRLQML
jgi:hypothetical protein